MLATLATLKDGAGRSLYFGGLGVLLGLILMQTLREPARGGIEQPALPPTVPVPSPMGRRGCGIASSVYDAYGFVADGWFRLRQLCRLGVAELDAYIPLHAISSQFGDGGFDSDRICATGQRCRCGLRYHLWPISFIGKRRAAGSLVQAAGVLGGAPFVVACGLAHSVAWLIVVLTAWGFFKGLYDANIFASVFDVVPPPARGRAAGIMNMVGWLGGGGAAPVVIGLIAQRYGLGLGISVAAVVYVFAAAFLLLAAVRYVERDSRRMLAAADPGLPEVRF